MNATAIRERINDHVAKATAIRTTLEAALEANKDEGGYIESAAYQEPFAEAEGHLTSADKLRETLHRQEQYDAKAAGLAEWQGQKLPTGDDDLPPPPVPNMDADALAGIEIGPNKLHLSRSAQRPELATAEYNKALEQALHTLPPGIPKSMDVLQAGIDELGGFLLVPDQQAEVLQRLAERSQILDMTTALPTSREQVTWWRVQAPSAAGDVGIFSSGFIGAFVAEIPAATAGETEPKFGRLNISVDKLRTKTFLGRDFVSDTDFDILAFLTRNGSENLGLVAQRAILIGDGVDQPLGITVDPDIATATDVSGTTADEISNLTTDIGSATKIMDLQVELPPQYWPNAVWAMHQKEELNIRKLVDGNNRFLWAAGFADRPNELLGFPVVRSSFMPEGGTDANVVIVWGDFSQYITPRRMAIAAQLDPFTKADVEQVTFYLRTRLGGRVANPEAFRLGRV